MNRLQPNITKSISSTSGLTRSLELLYARLSEAAEQTLLDSAAL